MGWKLVDDDNPLVAQSPLLSGRRQQIAVEFQGEPNNRTLRMTVPRLWTKNGMPYKAHTLRMRMNAFQRAVQG